MKNHSLLTKLVSFAFVCCTLSLGQSPAYSQGRSLSRQQVDAIVKPSLSQCTASTAGQVRVSGETKNARLDPNTIIPTRNAKEIPVARVRKTMQGMWHGQIIGSSLDTKTKESTVDYFWIIDTQRGEGLIIALRNGKNSLAGMAPVPNAPKLSYLICAHEGYLPSVEAGSEIHEFTKVSNSIAEAPKILANATGLQFKAGRPSLSDLWQQIVASKYFQSLPAVAFAGGFFKPIRVDLVPSPVGPAQVSMSWDSEYYGGGATGIQFTPSVPMKGVEYTTFVGTTATAGDYLVASPGNGRLAKVEATAGGSYDLAFDAASFGPLAEGGVASTPARRASRSIRANHRTGSRKNNHGRRQ